MGHVVGKGGKLVGCTSCDMIRRQAADMAAKTWRSWGLTDEEREWTFANGFWHDERWNDQPWIEDFRALASWMEAWAFEPLVGDFRWIAMLSYDGNDNFGIGKSYLGTCVVNAALSAGKPAHKWQTADLLDAMKSRIAPQAGMSYTEWFTALKEFQGILFLDDLGWEKASEWAIERLVLLLTYRAERSGWLPTVLAGNTTIEELRSVKPWLADRLSWPQVMRPASLSRFPSWRQLMADDAPRQVKVVAPDAL
jgi:hypothetical protein